MAKCKKCGKIFSYKPHKLFCSNSCHREFYKKIKLCKCIVCGKAFEGKQLRSKFCSKECKDAKRRHNYANNKKIEEAKKVTQKTIYDKQYNSNIEKCLNCKNDVCIGECEKINTLIKG